jgi:hypothetical protein
MRAPTIRHVVAAAALTALVGLAVAGPASAQEEDTTDGGDGFFDPPSDPDTASATATSIVFGAPGSDGGGGRSGGGGPNCTRDDGTPDYLRYEGLQWTTMEEQRTEIRPEEQRPGVYLHVYCGPDYVEFRFFPDGPPVPQVDPRELAETVTIRPPAPEVRTSPGPEQHLVGVEAWFWVASWEPETGTATAGLVSVTVTAEPTSIVVDPGDGSGEFTCTGRPIAYDTSRPASAQSSDCTHTYTSSGTFAATVTVVYGDVGYTSNVGPGGALPDIDTETDVELGVREAQAVVVD